MSNHIVEFRYFISSIVKSLDNNSEWLNNAREFECKCIDYSLLRLKILNKRLEIYLKENCMKHNIEVVTNPQEIAKAMCEEVVTFEDAQILADTQVEDDRYNLEITNDNIKIGRAYRHKKSGKEVHPIEFAKAKVMGQWIDVAIYVDAKADNYVRGVDEFLAKCELIK